MNDDMLSNWRNILPKSARLVAADTARTLQAEGYTAREAENHMLVNGFDEKTTGEVISELYNPETVVASTSRQVMVVPTSYSDVRAFVDAALDTSKPQDFVNSLARSERPIMRLNGKAYASFVRMAEQALNDDRARTILHDELKPYFEEAMYQSVCAAQKPVGRFALAASHGTRHMVVDRQGESHEVSLATGMCDCKRFREANFAPYGLACEHIVAAADVVSPHERLQREVDASTRTAAGVQFSENLALITATRKLVSCAQELSNLSTFIYHSLKQGENEKAEVQFADFLSNATMHLPQVIQEFKTEFAQLKTPDFGSNHTGDAEARMQAPIGRTDDSRRRSDFDLDDNWG